MKTKRKDAWLQTNWVDWYANFDCVCGKKDMMIGDEPKVCPNCKRTYYLSIGFYVEEPKNEEIVD